MVGLMCHLDLFGLVSSWSLFLMAMEWAGAGPELRLGTTFLGPKVTFVIDCIIGKVFILFIIFLL